MAPQTGVVEEEDQPSRPRLNMKRAKKEAPLIFPSQWRSTCLQIHVTKHDGAPLSGIASNRTSQASNPQDRPIPSSKHSSMLARVLVNLSSVNRLSIASS
jgi:hypothetical protein